MHALSVTGSPPPEAPLALARALTAADMERVNALLLARVQSPVPLIEQLARHLINSGGKRIRPQLTLLSARLCGYQDGERHIGMAAAVELLHTATLLHDDVVDESDLRRGQDTANAVFGNQASVLVGDYLLSIAFQLMVADGSLRVLKILSDAAATISRGEVMQLAAAGSLATPERDYLEIIRAKTAALFAAACEIGPALCGTETLEPVMRQVGEAIGMAFQLVDDALDYTGGTDAIGKSVGDDFREGKITLPVLLAHAAGNTEEKNFWKRCIETGDQRPEDLPQAIKYIEKHGAARETRRRAQSYCEEALNLLSALPPSAEKEALTEIIAFTVSRGF